MSETSTPKKRGRPAKRSNPQNNEPKKEEKIIVKKRPALDLNMSVAVTNMTHGVLVYVSKKNIGLEYIWNNFGDVEWLDLGELVSMKNSQIRFFKDNWIYIDDMEVLDFLSVSQYYENVPDIENFDELFKLPSAELQAKIASMSNGMKNSIAYRAVQLLESGELDSRRTIKALEKALGTELIEK